MIRNIRLTLRGLKKSPVYALVAIATLAIAIGANTAIFTIVDQLMLRMLPVRNPSELVQLTIHSSRRGEATIDRTISYPMFQAIRERNQVFSDAFLESTGMGRVPTARLSNGTVIGVQFVTENFFSSLGLAPAIGQFFSADDDHVGSQDTVAVISDSLWNRAFQRSSSAIGSTIKVEQQPVTIIGVAPPHFDGIDAGERHELWVPVTAWPRIEPRWSGVLNEFYRLYRCIGRLRPGISALQAQANVDVIYRAELVRKFHPENFPEVDRNEALSQHAFLQPAARGTDLIRNQFRHPLLLIMASVAIVLLIACINIASLLLARFASRATDTAVRLALGARTRHILAQVLAESILLSLLAGIAGLLLAIWGAQVVAKLMASGYLSVDFSTRPNWHMLAFVFSVACLAGVAFGVFPAWRASRLDPASLCVNRPGTTSSGQMGGKMLVAFQVALSFALVAAAGLLVQTLHNLATFDAGFDREQVAVFSVTPPASGMTRPQVAQKYEQLQSRLEQLPKIRAASYSTTTPAGDVYLSDAVSLGSNTPDSAHEIDCFFNVVGTHFFEAVRTPLLRGRDFQASDTATSTPVVIINQTLAKRYFGDRDPIGRELTVGALEDAKQYQVIGVAADARYGDLRDPAPPGFFQYMPQRTAGGSSGAWFSLQTTASVNELRVPVEKILKEVDPDFQISNFRPLAEQIDRTLFQEHAIASISFAFAVLAILLSSIGLYGSVAYSVERRTRELGIRMALGAQSRQVLRSVIKSSLLTVILGLVIGLPLALGAGRVIASQLFGVKPADSATLIATSLLLLVMALVASYPPARRAMQVDPAIALRAE